MLRSAKCRLWERSLSLLQKSGIGNIVHILAMKMAIPIKYNFRRI